MGKRLILVLLIATVLALLACGTGEKPAPAKDIKPAPTSAAAPAQPKATTTPGAQAPTPTPQAGAKPQPTAAAQPAGAGPAKLANVKMPEFIRIKGTSTPGSVLDIIAKGMIYNIEEAFPQVRCRNIPGGTYEGVWRLENGEVDLGVTNTSEPYVGWYGGGTYPKATKNIRTLFQMPYITTGFYVVLDSSKIQGIKDLDGKRIAVGPTGYTFARTVTPALLNLYGMSYESISAHGGSVLYTTTDVSLQMLGDGKLDVTLSSGMDPFGPVSALAQTHKIRILKLTDQEMAEVTRVAPGWDSSILPANMYKGQTEAIKVVSLGNPVLVHASLPNDVVYNLLWAIFKDNGQRYKDMHPRYLSEDLIATAIDQLIVPLHPGAETYWKQRGKTPGKALIDVLGPPK